MKNEEREEIERQLAAGAEGIVRIDLLNQVAGEYRFSDPDRMRQYATEAQQLSEQLDYASGLAYAERNLGSVCELRGDYAQSLTHLDRALELYKKSSASRGEMIAVNNAIAKVHANLGDYSKALAFLYDSLKVLEEYEDKIAEANTLNSMSVLYQRLGNFEKAESCARHCLELAGEIGERRVLGVARVNLGNAFGMTKNWQRALDQWEIALAIFESMNEAELQSSVLGNLGIANINLREFDRAEEHLLRCLAFKRQTGNRYDIVRSMQNLATLYSTMERFDKALECCREGLEISEQLDAKSLSFQLWREMAIAYKGKGDFENALSSFEKYHDLEKEIFTEEMRLKTDALQLRFAMEKTEKEKEIYRLKNIDLAEANLQITQQKEEIEEKSRDITASIRYAQRIQEALLPQLGAMRHGFAGAFVFYQPRDIVSGDFYWSVASDDAVMFAVADCTGHGVPGALMSVMGAAFLSEIVNERGVRDPAEALNLLRLKVITALHNQAEQEQADAGQLRDGMDIVLCRYEAATRKLSFACANNPLWILRNGAIIEFEADKFPVGLHHGNLQYFRSQQTELQPGDQLCLFTDGFADQFGGPKGKKLGYKKLRELLLLHHRLSPEEQKTALQNGFSEWKAGHDQVDDVLLVGIKI